MKEFIFTNSNKLSLNNILSEIADKADKIKIATAFFSDTLSIKKWLNQSKQVDLLVSLRPPTNYYSLKSFQSQSGINIQFLGVNFHSKFFIFYENEEAFACIIGSSNFTAGGLHKNIETNFLFTDTQYLKQIDKEFSMLWAKSFLLQPTDLEKFKPVFDAFQNRTKETELEQLEFENKILNNRNNQCLKIRIRKKAKEYFTFWLIVDEIKELVHNISQEEYPNIAVYLTIDHFWHWIKVVWFGQNNRTKPKISNRNIVIPQLFKEYCDWDKQNGNYTNEMARKSKELFAELLSEKNISNLTKENAKEIYANLHAGEMGTIRFGADKKFIEENSIENIRKALKYLLYSNEELDLRIHKLCFIKDGEYKLKRLNTSGTQELLGWVMPNKYPLKNGKADDALKLLGYQLN